MSTPLRYVCSVSRRSGVLCSGGSLDLSNLQLQDMPHGWLTFVERAHSIDSTDLSIPLQAINLSGNAFDRIPPDLLHNSRLSVRSLDLSANDLGNALTEQLAMGEEVLVGMSECDISMSLPVDGVWELTGWLVSGTLLSEQRDLSGCLQEQTHFAASRCSAQC